MIIDINEFICLLISPNYLNFLNFLDFFDFLDLIDFLYFIDLDLEFK